MKINLACIYKNVCKKDDWNGFQIRPLLQSSCVYHSRVSEEQRNRTNVEQPLVDTVQKEECKIKVEKCWEYVLIGNWDL